MNIDPAKLRRARKCVGIIEGYSHFREGQDGFAALLELRKFVDELEGELCPYGYCPHCGSRGVDRQFKGRAEGDNDTCEKGHVYPSRAAR